jgi:hypothetical protein
MSLNAILLGFGGVNDETIGSTTDLRAIPRARQHAKNWIYWLSALIDFIVTPFKSDVWSRELIKETKWNTYSIGLRTPHLQKRSPLLRTTGRNLRRCYHIDRR